MTTLTLIPRSSWSDYVIEVSHNFI